MPFSSSEDSIAYSGGFYTIVVRVLGSKAVPKIKEEAKGSFDLLLLP